MLNRRRRDVSCIRYGKKVNDYQCLYESKPAESISCVDECLKPHWKIFSWQSVRNISLNKLIDFISISVHRHVYQIKVFVIVVSFVFIRVQLYKMSIAIDN